ncbi:MAG: NupC/NupG family nucleoside CNT transporter [Deltaproteobacteria bacterium]|nr:NupC/NupG family nucleoside CNT transporter [Deltaproteobacteria bacterium]
MERMIGLLGLAVLLGCAYLLSSNRRLIRPRMIITGLAMQFVLGFMLLRWRGGAMAIEWFAGKVSAFLQLTDEGTRFLFGNIVNSEMIDTFGFQFAFGVLPIIIFFSAFMAVLYYFGIMQWIIEIMAIGMRRIMGTSGAETLSCTANIFVGQTEAPLLIRPFLARLTSSELLTVMVGGFATIAGSVLGAYVKMGVNPAHLIVGSCMAVPAALMIGKIVQPETEHSETAGDAKLPKLDVGSNLLDAIARGTTDGLHLALNVGAMLLAFIALIAFVNLVLGWIDTMVDGRFIGAPLVDGEYRAATWYGSVVPGSLKTLFGTLLRPLAVLMGVPSADATAVGHLIGIKLSVNEFIGYAELTKLTAAGLLSHKGETIATFALCGFANFSSIGIQIGGLSALAPNRRADLARLAFRAMLGGAIATCMTGTIAGMLL